MQDHVQIEFTKPYNMYRAGQKAGFPANLATQIIQSGAAKLVPLPDVKPDIADRVKTKIITK